MRRRLLLLSGLILLPSLGGCTVPVGGVTAVAADEAGAPVAVVVMCEGRIDGLTLNDVEDSDLPVAGLEVAAPVTAATQVRLAVPGAGWTVTTPLASLRDGRTYSLYGWTRDNEWSSNGVDFTPADLRGLKAGQVLWQKFDEEKGDIVDVVEDVTGFRAHACDDFAA